LQKILKNKNSAHESEELVFRGAGNGTPIELLRSPLMGFLLCLRVNEKIFEECENIFQKK
jgi:hypothetical protein